MTASEPAAEHALLRLALDAVPLHIAVLDDAGEIRYCNALWREFATQNGGAEDLCLGRGNYLQACENAAQGGSAEAAQIAEALRAIAAGERSQFEVEYPCHSPIVQRWFLLRIVPVTIAGERYLLVTHDQLTDRRPARHAIEAERAKLRTLLQTATDGLHVLDESGNVVFSSDSFAEMLGYAKSIVAGLNITRWLRPDSPMTSQRTLALLNGPAGSMVTQFLHRDGRTVHVELTHRRVTLEGVAYLYCSARDIAERILQQRDADAHLQEMQRINQELDDFVYVASHDLRAPLRAVGHLAHWIREDELNLGAKTTQRLLQIEHRVERMTQLLNDIQEYATVGGHTALSGEPQDVDALVQAVAETLNVPNGFTVQRDATLAGIRATRAPLSQVLHNLIGNAIKHHDQTQGCVCVSVEDCGDQLRFAVLDDGPGIPAKHRESVFAMFSKLKSGDEVEGSGLGLALVRKIVRQLGGECRIGPSEGRGTRIEFDWPKWAPPTSDRPAEASGPLIRTSTTAAIVPDPPH